jgi:prepilin-type N-terminal cleavage/methylation domain-containing protein
MEQQPQAVCDAREFEELYRAAQHNTMKKLMTIRHKRHAAGFTLIETLITLVILSVIMGAVFKQIDIATKRSSAEQTKLDMFQESREFMDQMSRDIRNAGYPNIHNFNATAPGTATTNARGLIYVGPGDVWFEGDVDGTGQVSYVKYHLDTSTSANCPCLRRSKQAKIGSGFPPDYYAVEVQGVQNPSTTNWKTANPVFTYYFVDGTQLDLSGYTNNVIDGTTTTTSADFVTLAKIDRVKVQLSVQSKYADLQTQLKPILTLNSTIMIYNCNYASGSTATAVGQGEIWACQ